jgi:ABC-2 type transport system ATP-binding protein
MSVASPMIRVRHLWHRFGARDVLRDVTFDVGAGEIFGFIGPNGAGKTTTIRVMATLLEPTAGRVEIDGVDVTVDPDAVRRSIGYMPDHAGIYERITVREYLEFFASAYGAAPSVVGAVLELTDLAKLEDRIVAAMSKGMKQRLQLARVLLHDPKVLILDEPASDLDPRARIEIRDLLLELRALGKTIFLSSHILTELADVCTSVAILERGQLVVAGPIAHIGAELDRRRRVGDAAPLDRPADAPAPAPAPYGLEAMVRLRVLGSPEAAAALLAGQPGVASVEAAGGALHVRHAGGDASVAAIVERLVRGGVGVVGVEPERSELERIFLEVTRGEVQ